MNPSILLVKVEMKQARINRYMSNNWLFGIQCQKAHSGMIKAGLTVIQKHIPVEVFPLPFAPMT